MTGWVTVSECLDYLHAHLAKANTESLQDHWNAILTATVRQAYWDILSAFTGRGYSKAQVDEWDRGPEFQQDIAVHLALKRLAAMSPDYNQAALDAIDRRPELLGDQSKGIEPLRLTIGGVVQEPELTHGQVTYGPLDNTDDLFVADPDDTRRGVPTRL